MPALVAVHREGHVWHDLHMLFFRLLAVASILCDWKAPAAATALLPSTHLGLEGSYRNGFFTGDSLFVRIAFHAVILVVSRPR
jgi:methyl-accepting chemotaxis protein